MAPKERRTEEVNGGRAARGLRRPAQDVAWHGTTVHTGVWKHAVTGPRMVRRLNIDGDGQGDLGGHGGEQRAVLVYQIDSYRHWQRELGRDDFVLRPVRRELHRRRLPDDEVCIGDRYQIGEAVFEVTQPRVTCYRVGMRHGRAADGRAAGVPPAARLLPAGADRGVVEAGDEIVKVGSGPEAMTVAEIDALLYLPGHPRDAGPCAAHPRAEPGWRPRSGAARPAATHGVSRQLGLTRPASPPPAWPGFRPLRVIAASSRERQRSARCGWLILTARPFRRPCRVSTSPCACARTPPRRRSSAAIRCPADRRPPTIGSA